jgi:hypothetical protein
MNLWLVLTLLAPVQTEGEPGAAEEVPATPAVAPAGVTRWAGMSGSAYALPAGAFEVGLFQPLRYGLGREVELSTHAALNLVMPNLALLKTWGQVGPMRWASRHALYYPTGLLQLVAREGTGGILPEETRVPHIIMLGNEARLSWAFAAQHLLTARAGVTVAAALGRANLSSIDLPLVWPRLAPVFNYAAFVVGADLDGVLCGPLDYFADLDLYLIPDGRGPVAVEQAAALRWRVSETFAAMVGTKLVFGTYPAPGGFRSQWHLLPIADLTWRF